MDSSKLIKLIRKVVKEEVRKAVKPLVNEVLAEHFVKVLGESREAPRAAPALATDETEKLAKRRAREKQMLQEKINKIAGGDPMSEMIFGDLDNQDRSAFHAPEAPAGSYVDTDDDGVDLSQFGL